MREMGAKMWSIIEVQIGDGKKRPRIVKRGDLWVVESDVEQHVAHGRAVWVRTFDHKGAGPKDGKGLLCGPTRKLTRG